MQIILYVCLFLSITYLKPVYCHVPLSAMKLLVGSVKSSPKWPIMTRFSAKWLAFNVFAILCQYWPFGTVNPTTLYCSKPSCTMYANAEFSYFGILPTVHKRKIWYADVNSVYISLRGEKTRARIVGCFCITVSCESLWRYRDIVAGSRASSPACLSVTIL